MSYRIEDEPRPGGLARWAVNPVWPLFVVMFGGAAWSWSWFVLNGFALGSPTRKRETVWAVSGAIGNVVLVAGILVIASSGLIEQLGVRYTLVGLTVWKLAVSYRLFMLQSRTFHLFEYFGGQARNGMLVVFVAWFATQRLIQALPTLWVLILR